MTAGIRFFGVLALIVMPSFVIAQSGPGRGVVRGTVMRDSSGQPLPNAELSLSPAGLSVRADSKGNFVFRGITTAQQRLTVRAVGYAAAEALLNIPAKGLEDIEVALFPAVNTLEKVETRKDAVPRHLVDFASRRKMGIGRFADSTVLWRQGDPGRWYDRIEERFAGLRLVPAPSGMNGSAGPALRMFATPLRGQSSWSAGTGPCPVRVLIDGYPAFGADEKFVVEQWDGPPIVAAEFYTVAETPAEFNRLGERACGVLVLWTRR